MHCGLISMRRRRDAHRKRGYQTVTTEGIEAVFLTTHNWGKAAKFFQALGYQIEFETDHHSGQLRSATGPYLFIAEIPAGETPNMQAVLKIADAAAFRPPDGVEVASPFEATHWGTQAMTVRDPDGRLWTIEGPGDE
jgi:hypothetical protein